MSFWKVRIEKVLALEPIKDADKIEVATISGWKCIVQKGQFKIGDSGVYMPIDTVLPENDERFKFLTDKGIKRIRTIKLRGQISQGLFMPLSILGSKLEEAKSRGHGEQIADLVGVTHYEPPIPMDGQSIGPFPTFGPKTDEERIQNIPEYITKKLGCIFEISEKLDGCSSSYYYYNGKFGVCKRGWEVSNDGTNVWSAMAKKYNIEDAMRKRGDNLIIQGEIVGPGVQGNKYKLASQQLFVFKIFDIDNQVYLGNARRYDICKQMGLQHVPIIDDWFVMPETTVDGLLSMAGGTSKLANVKREGLVFKELDGFSSFKVIDNEWLLKNE